MSYGRRRRLERVLLTALLVAGLAPAWAQAGKVVPDWNDAEIDWRSYDDGSLRMEILGKPGIVILYADWCPRCVEYGALFRDPEIVALSRRFVMMRIDVDAEAELDERFSERGRYVPRTLFLDAGGEVDWSIRGVSDGYPFFLDTRSPAELLELMERRLADLRG